MATEYVIQGYYGGVAGWENLTFDETPDDAERSLADYSAREPDTSLRVMTRRTGWYITFSNRRSVIVYTEAIARSVTRKEQDPHSFVNGNVTSVEKVVTEWHGSHDDDSRVFTEVSRETVDFKAWQD